MISYVEFRKTDAPHGSPRCPGFSPWARLTIRSKPRSRRSSTSRAVSLKSSIVPPIGSRMSKVEPTISLSK